MFFPQLMNIKNSDKVLEIGPGAYPYWRSDVLADKFDSNDEVDLTQFGGKALNTKGKPLYKIIDNKLPFEDKEFDYTICSHVLEHVPAYDLPMLIKEIMRVSAKSYIEFPRPMYDFVYNFEVHLNLLDIVSGEIVCISKENTNINFLKRFQDYSLYLRKRNLFSIEEPFLPLIAVGYEFTDKIPLRIVKSEDEFWEIIYSNDYFIESPSYFWRLKNKINLGRLFRALNKKNSNNQ